MAFNAASSSSASSSTGAVRMGRAQQHNQPYPPAGSRGAKPSVVLNPELWEDLGNPAIPPAMSPWHAALKDMNKDAKRVSPNVPKVAYFFPSLSLFVRGESSNRQQRYLRNWLVSQVGWITHLSALDASPVIPQSWWDFLNTIPKQISSTFSGD
ncbi:hypothetical protein F5J12DRAFT_892963 [Pisolithus orientalis]|uniref:uncharacterized protein n=1 Tax=Pisolithus orientalis TaxID=936130 RepID=UPI0022253BDC|nr:uncharacterized protein F5J12DRAFT_892963 [Pisolithus orientalis]KAI6006226.1 hypothetical protein F5J12DRAFT_892963 [Pisolithus orientalis]